MSYLTVADHRSMALDATRNDAYHTALAQVVDPSTVVLDVGAGTGIHGLMAARLGAKRVYLVEPEDILFVAEEIVRANGLQDVVTCLQGRIQDIKVPERVDVIVSAMTGNFLLTEDLLPALFHARDTMLKPGGVLIPSAATMEAVPVTAEALHAKEIAAWSVQRYGLDLSPARPYSANTVFYRPDDLRRAIYLADPLALTTIDLSCASYASLSAEGTYKIEQSGTCHGMAGWFRMKLGESWLSTSPGHAALHWSPAFLPLDPPLVVERGEQLSFTLHRAPYGDWAWTVRCGDVSRQHSTVLSTPLSAATVQRATVDYRPSLNADGHDVMHVLSLFDGSTGADLIARSMCAQYPDRYPAVEDALRFVQSLVKRFA